MTSLIFGTIYMGHKGIINHRREKQRQKNYERWEGLRDEYDEMKKTSRRSMDTAASDIYGRTSDEAGYRYSESDMDRPILTLRDQQEAGDARTGWRPQEGWDAPRRHLMPAQTGSYNSEAGRDVFSPHPASAAAAPYNHYTPFPPPQTHSPAPSRNTPTGVPAPRQLPQKTGATWDDSLPAPLQVSKRNFEEYHHPFEKNSPFSGQRDGSTSVESLTRVQRPVVGFSSGPGTRESSASREPTRSGVPVREEVPVVESPFEWWKQ